MTGSTKQSSFVLPQEGTGLLRRFAPRNDDSTKSYRALGHALDQRNQRCNVRKNEIGLWHGRSQFDVAPVDPGDRQAERLAADHVGELRLPGMQDLIQGNAGVLQQIAEESPVRLVAARLFGRENQIEFAL